MTYTAAKPALPQTSQELRARVPGWGVDLDLADRPAVPRELSDPATGAHWDFPDRQPELIPRERSVEHGMLPPVFGSTFPPRGISGAIRRFSYKRFSEARAAHWLLLILADRVDAVEHRGRSVQTAPKSANGQRRGPMSAKASPLVIGGVSAGGALALLAAKMLSRGLRRGR